MPLPRFAVEMLQKRHGLPYLGEQAVIFPSTAGTLRDPNNLGREWRKAREELGVPDVTTLSFRKTVAALIGPPLNGGSVSEALPYPGQN